MPRPNSTWVFDLQSGLLVITRVAVEKLALECACDPGVIFCGDVVGFPALSFSLPFLDRRRSRLQRFHSQKLGQPFEVLGRGRE